jgi:hypothetical protein
MNCSEQTDNSSISSVGQIGLVLKGDILEKFHPCQQWATLRVYSTGFIELMRYFLNP